jgi:hypothetical protein
MLNNSKIFTLNSPLAIGRCGDLRLAGAAKPGSGGTGGDGGDYGIEVWTKLHLTAGESLMSNRNLIICGYLPVANYVATLEIEPKSLEICWKQPTYPVREENSSSDLSSLTRYILLSC